MIAVLVLERLEETWLSTIEEGGGGIEVELSLEALSSCARSEPDTALHIVACSRQTSCGLIKLSCYPAHTLIEVRACRIVLNPCIHIWEFLDEDNGAIATQQEVVVVGQQEVYLSLIVRLLRI